MIILTHENITLPVNLLMILHLIVAACGPCIMTVCHSVRRRAALSQTDDISVTVTCNDDVMTLVLVHTGAEQVDCTCY